MPMIWLKFNGKILTDLHVVDNTTEKILVNKGKNTADPIPVYYPSLGGSGIVVAVSPTRFDVGEITLNYTLDGTKKGSKSIQVRDGINEVSSSLTLVEVAENLIPMLKGKV